MRVGVLIAFAGLLGGCGDEPASLAVAPAGRPDDGYAWHVVDHEDARTAPRWRLRDEDRVQAQQVWPEARCARFDDPAEFAEVPRYVLNVHASGDVHFHGRTYKLRTSETARWTDEHALREDLRLLTDAAEFRDEGGRSRIPLMLNASRDIAWELVPGLIRIAMEPGIRMHALQWVVYVWHSMKIGRHGAVVGELPVGSTDVPVPQIELAAAIVADGAEVRLGVGDRSWSFGSSATDYLDPHFIEAANRVWAEAATAMTGALGGSKHVALRLPEGVQGVTWGHVVKVFDLLLGTGVRIVDLPKQGWRLTMEEPDAPAR